MKYSRYAHDQQRQRSGQHQQCDGVEDGLSFSIVVGGILSFLPANDNLLL